MKSFKFKLVSQYRALLPREDGRSMRSVTLVFRSRNNQPLELLRMISLILGDFLATLLASRLNFGSIPCFGLAVGALNQGNLLQYPGFSGDTLESARMFNS